MKKIVLSLLMLFFIFSCKKEEKLNNKTFKPNQEIKIKDTLQSVSIEKSFFSVYELSKNTTAIVVNLYELEPKTEFDKIFDEVLEQDSLYNVLVENNTNKMKRYDFYDTIGIYKLIKNKLLTSKIKKIIQKEYYIYGTKGFSIMKVEDIICGLDECRTNFIGFTIKNFDTKKNGNPVLCSSQLLNLNYGTEYIDIENKLKKINDPKILDYTDHINAKVFANIGSTYFAYYDDFMWSKNPQKAKSKFPTRAIYEIKNDSIKEFWIDSLDLFGIPCD